MKSEILQDAIGGIRDEYVLDAHTDKVLKTTTKLWQKVIAIAACLCFLIVASVPALAAVNNELAYSMLYSIFPSIAQKLKAVHTTCVYDGIEMEVISAYIHNERAEILVSMRDTTGSRLDETTDLFDSYSINKPFSSSATCNLVDYNEETGTVTFLISLTQWDEKPIPGDKITFSVRNILSNKQHEDLALKQIDLTAVPQYPDLLEKPQIRGWGGSGSEPINSEQILKPQQRNSFSPISGVSITGTGIVDGKLHIQAFYGNILETDNHGDIYLRGSDGYKVSCEYNVSFWDESHQNSYTEYVFDIPLEKLAQYQACGEFWTCSTLIHGEWQVTFPLTEE